MLYDARERSVRYARNASRARISAPHSTAARFSKNTSTASRKAGGGSSVSVTRERYGERSPQESRQPPVLEHAPTGLLDRAVAGHVVLEEHRLECRAAARARLALARVHLQRHRRLVGHRVADDLLVVLERATQDGIAGFPKPLHRLVVQLGA